MRRYPREHGSKFSDKADLGEYTDSGVSSEGEVLPSLRGILKASEGHIEEFNTGSSTSRRKAYSSLDIKVFSLNGLQNLVDYACEVSRGKRYPSATKFRYLVTTDYELLLALEGSPSPTIPAHYRMVSDDRASVRCLAAGNIKIDEGKVTFISNKSGDFTPSPFSMSIAMAIICSHPSVSFSEQVKVRPGVSKKDECIFSSGDIHQYVQSLSTEAPFLYFPNLTSINSGLDSLVRHIVKKPSSIRGKRPLSAKTLSWGLSDDTDDISEGSDRGLKKPRVKEGRGHAGSSTGNPRKSPICGLSLFGGSWSQPTRKSLFSGSSSKVPDQHPVGPSLKPAPSFGGPI